MSLSSGHQLGRLHTDLFHFTCVLFTSHLPADVLAAALPGFVQDHSLLRMPGIQALLYIAIPFCNHAGWLYMGLTDVAFALTLYPIVSNARGSESRLHSALVVAVQAALFRLCTWLLGRLSVASTWQGTLLGVLGFALSGVVLVGLPSWIVKRALEKAQARATKEKRKGGR